jgi:hypothetical protein
VQALYPYATSTERYNPYNVYGIEPVTAAAIISGSALLVGKGIDWIRGRKEQKFVGKATKGQRREARRQEAHQRESARLAAIEARRQERQAARASQMQLLALQVQAQQAQAERAAAGPRQTRILLGVGMGIVGLIVVASVLRRRAR